MFGADSLCLQYKIAEILVTHGANMNLPNRFGEVPDITTDDDTMIRLLTVRAPASRFSSTIGHVM